MKIQILILGFKGLMKGAVDHLYLVHFVNNASYESYLLWNLGRKLLVNDKILALFQTNMSPKH